MGSPPAPAAGSRVAGPASGPNRNVDWGGEVAALRDGRADVAFVWPPADLTGPYSEVIHSEPRSSACPGGTGRPHATR
ncbi:hypothetical protein SHL15_5513 [Streptomyces hygroscopicus subsp. limoneus]|nr:hypothetical protein SHL15_5513 [Streptomyces hygroscopicus subsp. limoneus]